MPLLDITNPAVIKFLVESNEKTTRMRLKWNTQHSELLKHCSVLNRKEKGYIETDVLKNTMVGGMATITRDNIVARRNRRSKPIRDGVHVMTTKDLRKGHSIPEVGLGDPKEDPRLARLDTDLTTDPIMRPVDPKQKEIIYKDLPVYGRREYLKSRNRMPTENKFYFAECGGWHYGWRLKDSYFGGNAPSHGRVWSLTRDSASRSGPNPDPLHYKNPDSSGNKKCD